MSANGTPRQPLWSCVPSPSHFPLYPSFGCPEASRVCHDTPHPIRIRGACDPSSLRVHLLRFDQPPQRPSPINLRLPPSGDSEWTTVAIRRPRHSSTGHVRAVRRLAAPATALDRRVCSPSCEGLTAVLPSPLRAPSTRCSDVASASSFVLNVLQGAICCGRPSDCRGLVQALQCLSDPLHHVPKSRRPPGERLRGPSGLADPTQDG